MNCTPSAILEASKCYCGLTSREDSSVSIYLLCQWANSLGPSGCGTPGEYILISGAGSGEADGTYVHNPTSPNIWNSATDTQAYIRLFGGNYFLEYGLAAHQLYKTTGANWPCTWETDIDGTNPAPTGQWISPPVSWTPSTELVTWNDSGGAHVGDLPTFLATADLITVSSLVFGATGNLTSLTGLKYLPSLLTIVCNNNALTSLDCTNCFALTTLNCSSNASLTTLTLTGCTALTTLTCQVSGLTSLDVTPCSSLVTLLCNQCNLTSLLVNGVSTLDTIFCEDNSIPTLVLTGCTGLTTLVCDTNALTALDVSPCTSLDTLDCDNNVSLTTLTLTGCTLLTDLNCSLCPLSGLDLSTNTSLSILNCGSCTLATLNVSTCTLLTVIDCSNNSIVSLDVSACTGLTNLFCNDNSLTSLNVTGCTSISALYCFNNSLSSLSISGFTAITDLECNNNALTNSNPTYIINNLLVDLVATTLQGGYMDCSGQTPAAPPSVGPPDGVAAVATLTGYGSPWTVITD